MHAGDGDAVFEAHQLGQHLRALDDGNLAGVGLYHLGIGSADRRTGDHDRGPGYVPGVMAFINCRPQLRKPVGHRTAAQIGARDLHLQAEQNLRNPAHADAADADEVRVLGGGEHGGAKLHFTIRAGRAPEARIQKTLPFCLS